jgi:hypothetical protein
MLRCIYPEPSALDQICLGLGLAPSDGMNLIQTDHLVQWLCIGELEMFQSFTTSIWSIFVRSVSAIVSL